MSAVQQASQFLSRRDLGGALSALQRGASAGETECLIELGAWFLEGRHVVRDFERARDYFRRASDLGARAAQDIYISFLANGIGGAADWSGALARLRSLARSNARAARQVALLERMETDAAGYPAAVPVARPLSDRPEVAAFSSFLTSDECAYLIDTAIPLLEPSMIVDPLTGGLRPDPVRTSEGAAFPIVSEDLVISAINRRIAKATRTDYACGEPLQILRYRPGQEYRAHFDGIRTAENQRIWTMLLYLNADYSGGETFFTTSGLKFSGKTGDALLFRNAEPRGLPDPLSKHAGLPVFSGEKYLATRWIRERPIMRK